MTTPGFLSITVKNTLAEDSGASSSFPVLDCVKAETEGCREARLRHLQTLADVLNADLGGEVDFVVSGFAVKKGFDLVEACHQVFKHGCHDSASYSIGHYLSGTPDPRGERIGGGGGKD
jgi:hypothetical protein